MRSPIRTTRLSLEALDARIVPATARLDLTAPGAQATAAGAIVRQADARPADTLDTFLRIDGGKVEQGYNTDARPLQFNERAGRQVTHSLTLGDVPRVVVGGATYREFVLDVREQNARVSLDEVRIFLGSTPNLKTYKTGQDTLAGRTAAFDLDRAGDVSVLLNARTRQGTGMGDMTLLVPESAFGGAGAGTFVYLYSKFGGQAGWRADGGAESWAVSTVVTDPGTDPETDPGTDPEVPAPETGTASLSGYVLIDNGSGSLSPFANVRIRLFDENGEQMAEATTSGSGAYSFTGLTAGTYTIVQVNPVPFAISYADGPESVGTAGGSSDANDQFTVALADGQAGADYNFTEILVG